MEDLLEALPACRRVGKATGRMARPVEPYGLAGFAAWSLTMLFDVALVDVDWSDPGLFHVQRLVLFGLLLLPLACIRRYNIGARSRVWL